VKRAGAAARASRSAGTVALGGPDSAPGGGAPPAGEPT
jgi:hypothetical protein